MGVEKRFTGPARLASWAPSMDVIALVSAEGCGCGCSCERRLKPLRHASLTLRCSAVSSALFA